MIDSPDFYETRLGVPDCVSYQSQNHLLKPLCIAEKFRDCVLIFRWKNVCNLLG